MVDQRVAEYHAHSQIKGQDEKIRQKLTNKEKGVCTSVPNNSRKLTQIEENTVETDNFD